jgi:hypothetical protein
MFSKQIYFFPLLGIENNLLPAYYADYPDIIILIRYFSLSSDAVRLYEVCSVIDCDVVVCVKTKWSIHISLART